MYKTVYLQQPKPAFCFLKTIMQTLDSGGGLNIIASYSTFNGHVVFSGNNAGYYGGGMVVG